MVAATKLSWACCSPRVCLYQAQATQAHLPAVEVETLLLLLLLPRLSTA